MQLEKKITHTFVIICVACLFYTYCNGTFIIIITVIIFITYCMQEMEKTLYCI